MVSFSCESCSDVLVKKKLDAHVNRCPSAQFTCLDCSTTFKGTSYREHTSCISEAQKYQKSVYRPEKKKGKEKGKEKGTDTDKTKMDPSHQGSQNESGGNDVGSHNGKVKSGGTQSVALGPDEGDTPLTDKQKEAEEETDKLAKEPEAKAHEAKEEEGKTVGNGGDKKKETRAVKNPKEKGDKKRKWKSSEVVVSEEDEESADKLKKKKKGEEQEGEVQKQPKSKKSKNKDPKKSEEKSSVLPAVVPPPETSHQHDTASIPSTTVNENNAQQPPTTPTPVPSGVDLPASKALSSQHFLGSIPTGKDILMVRLIKKLKKTGSENEVWELLKRAKVAKDSDGKVVLTLQ